MLSTMGWEEGSEIGTVGVLEHPIVAVIKAAVLRRTWGEARARA